MSLTSVGESRPPDGLPSTRPFIELEALTRRMASGEFIAAAHGCEVHLYLQEGRFAWAYSTKNRGTFRAYLETACGVTPSEFSDIIETCRRERAPLGETLVRLKLASTEQVSRALRQQIAEAIEVLRELGDAPVMFLARDATWRKHDRFLTFTLDAVATHVPHPHPAPPLFDARALADEVREALPSLEWVAVSDASAVLYEELRGRAFETPPLHCATVAQGAHLVLSRNGSRTIVGVAVGDAAASLWGCLSSGVSLSEALTVFSRFGTQAPSEAEHPCPEGAPLRDGPLDSRFDTIAESLMRDANVWAVISMNRDGTRGATLVRPSVPLDRLVAPLIGRSALLVPQPVDLQSLSVLAMADSRGWWFGAALGDSTAWLLACPTLAPGLGIALLRSLAQTLTAVED